MSLLNFPVGSLSFIHEDGVSNLVVLDEPLEHDLGQGGLDLRGKVSNLVVLDEPLER